MPQHNLYSKCCSKTESTSWYKIFNLIRFKPVTLIDLTIVDLEVMLTDTDNTINNAHGEDIIDDDKSKPDDDVSKQDQLLHNLQPHSRLQGPRPLSQAWSSQY